LDDKGERDGMENSFNLAMILFSRVSEMDFPKD
jgi:hypothetical protein